MLDTGILQVTGRGRNVNFAIDDSLPLEAVIQELRRSLAQNQLLYSRGSVTVEVGRRMLAREELTEIKRVLESESGLTISQFWCSPAVFEGASPVKAGRGLGLTQPAPPAAPGPGSPDLLPDHLDEAVPSLAVSRPEENESSEGSLEAEQAPVPWLEPDFSVRPEVLSAVQLAAQQSRQEENGQPDVSSLEPDPLEAVAESALLTSTPAPDDDDEITEAPQAPEDPPPPSINAVNAVPAWPVAQEPESTISPDRTIIDLEQEVVGLYRGNEALLVKTTCRSGEVIRYPGDIVVLADVNPGAEIIAEGDILVYGTLRGLAHAGAGGDIQATIIAVKLEASRLQIGPHTGMAPKTKQRPRSPQTGPMIAYVRRQHIFVATFAGRFARYSGGTLYDG